MFNLVLVPVVYRLQSADIVSAWKQQQTAVLIKLDNNLASQAIRPVFRLHIYISLSDQFYNFKLSGGRSRV